MKTRIVLTVALITFLLCAAAVASPAQTFTSLASFDGTNGGWPEYESLVQGTDGNFYGTTAVGGNLSCDPPYDFGCGTIFKISAVGALTAVYSFCPQTGCADGAGPVSGLILGTDGNFYGTTSGGGTTNSQCPYGCGTVFRVTPAGALSTLYRFNFSDGDSPHAPLVQGTDGNFYGTTSAGGANGSECSGLGCGTVFKITSAGQLTTLYSFCAQSNCTDGSNPYAGLVQATNGTFYGTTYEGGSSANCPYGCGTVFAITAAGKLTTLHSFDSSDGRYPDAGLVQAANHKFYGTTAGGGSSTACNTFGCGTVFAITSAGKLTTLYNFCSQNNCADGVDPTAVLVQATDGNFYGTTNGGGTSSACYRGCGSIFEITAAGKLTTIFSFDLADGATPYGGLLQATNGTFYGTTYDGGSNDDCAGGGCGTVFSLATGLGPFVETNPTSGKVGKKVTILGNSLSGATSVKFNGTAAKFKASDSEITTHVPTGTTSGFVTVTTPGGTLKSNLVFRVTK
jgi:uncharacterized repeat protein (TIGR03803 family)